MKIASKAFCSYNEKIRNAFFDNLDLKYNQKNSFLTKKLKKIA